MRKQNPAYRFAFYFLNTLWAERIASNGSINPVLSDRRIAFRLEPSKWNWIEVTVVLPIRFDFIFRMLLTEVTQFWFCEFFKISESPLIAALEIDLSIVKTTFVRVINENEIVRSGTIEG